MKILGISAYYHDSVAAIVQDGKVLFAAQEERFSRIKNDASFSGKAIEYCLNESGFSYDDIDLIAFYDKLFLKFERLLFLHSNRLKPMPTLFLTNLWSCSIMLFRYLHCLICILE